MNDTTYPNATAFPIAYNDLNEVAVYGLTKREYFTAMALQGLAAAHKLTWNGMASTAVALADMTIKKLNEKEVAD